MAEGLVMSRLPSPDRPRSQQIMRLPVDTVAASIILDDGERFDAMLFLPPGDTVVRLFVDGDAFLPVAFRDRIRLVARAAISALTVAAEPHDNDLPHEQQKATVRMRSGAMVEGELRWVGPHGRRRTVDFLNEDEAHIVVHGPGVTTYVRKAHVAWVEET